VPRGTDQPCCFTTPSGTARAADKFTQGCATYLLFRPRPPAGALLQLSPLGVPGEPSRTWSVSGGLVLRARIGRKVVAYSKHREKCYGIDAQLGEAVYESLRDHSCCGNDCRVRPCHGASYPQCRQSHSGTCNSYYFHHDQLHDVLQFAGGELSIHVLHSGAAHSPP
jgi:hypothetical protein